MPITEATRRGWKVAYLRKREELVRGHFGETGWFHPDAQRMGARWDINDYAFCGGGFDVAALEREACGRLVYAHSLTATPRVAPWGHECAALDYVTSKEAFSSHAARASVGRRAMAA